MMAQKFYVNESDAKKRLDVFVSFLPLNISRSQAKNLIENGCILVNDKLSKPSYSLIKGDKVAIEIPEPKKIDVVPQQIPLDFIYEDSDIAVVNKPYGLVVHPASGNHDKTLVNALLYHCNDLSGIGGVLRPGIVHRLDKDTSGVMVIAKNDQAHQSLSKQFKRHEVKKVYVAIVKGRVKNDKGEILAPVGRHPVDRKKMAVIIPQPTGKKHLKAREAITHYKVLRRLKDEKGNKYSLLELQILTGRTHQIRVHLNYLGHPIVGDKVYGGLKSKSANFVFYPARQLLHAKTLAFLHPTTKEYLKFSSDLPDDMKLFLENLKNDN